MAFPLLAPTAAVASRRSYVRSGAGLLLVAVAYYAAVRLGLVFELRVHGITAAWPPSGLVLGVLLVMPRRTWPAILATIVVTNGAANVLGGRPWVYTVGFSLVDAAEGLAAAGLVTLVLRGRPTLSRLRDVVAIVLVAAVGANALTAVGGAAVAVSVSNEPFWPAWFTWWMSNGIGMLLLAPLVLAVAERPRLLPRTRRERLELSGLYVLLVVGGTWIFSGRTFEPSLIPFPYLTFPALLWAALRFGPFHACASSLAIALIAGWQTGHGAGPFVMLGDMAGEVLALQAFVGVSAVSALVAGAVVEERRRVEESLEVYRQFSDHAADAILFVRTSDCRILDANRAASIAYGYTPDELRGLGLHDLLLPETLPGLADRVATADREGVLFETTHRRRDGSPFPVEVHASGVTLRGERVVVSVHRDISTRRQVEAARRAAEEASARAQGRFKAVFENARDAIVVLDGGRCVDANLQAERLLGLPP